MSVGSVRVVGVVFVLFLLAGASVAQTNIKFDPDEHLKGYTKAQFSDYASLYDFKPFEKSSGNRVNAARLRELRSAWDAEIQRVAALVRGMDADPKKRVLFETRKALERDRYFKTVDYELVADHYPLVFCVQKIQRGQADYVKESIAKFEPWMRSLEKHFAAWAGRVGLTRRKDYGHYVVAILSSKGAYTNYADATRSQGLYRARAHYDPRARIAVTYEDRYSTAHRDDVEKVGRHAILHEYVHALVDSYKQGKGRANHNVFLSEGLAEYFATHYGTSPSTLESRPLNRRHVDTLVSFGRSAWMLFPLSELLTFKDYRAAVIGLVNRSRAKGLAMPPDFTQDAALGLLYAQAGTMLNFLHEAHGGRYTARTRRMIAAWQNGAQADEAFAKEFKGIDAATLDAEFVKFVNADYARRHPKRRAVKLTPPEQLNAPTARAIPNTAAPTKSAAPTGEVDPSGLAIAKDDIEARHGMALYRARRGDLAGAVRALEPIASASGKGSDGAKRELARLRKLEVARRGLIKHIRSRRSSLRIKYRAREQRGKITALENGVISLKPRRGKALKIPLSALDPRQLGSQMRVHKYPCDEWLPHYARVLGGETKAIKSLERTATAEDVEDAKEMEKLMAVGEIASILDELSEPRPADATGAEPVVRLELALRRHKDSHLVAERRSLLRDVAYGLLAKSYTPEKALTRLAGKMKKLPGDRVRVTYDFTSKREANDFTPSRFMDAARREFPPIGTSHDSSFFEVQAGEWAGKGQLAFEYALALSAPLSVKAAFKFGASRRPGTPWVDMYVCANGDDSWILSRGLYGDIVRQEPRRAAKMTEGSPPSALSLDKTYEIEVRHDGRRVESFRDGSKIAQAGPGKLQSGSIYLWFHTDYPVKIDRLVIEGKLDEAALSSGRDTWISSKLEAMGL